MNRITLMMIAGAAMPVALIAQTTMSATPPTEVAANTIASDPTMTTTDAVANTAANTTATTPDAASNITTSEPDPTDNKAEKKKNKKPTDATETRL